MKTGARSAARVRRRAARMAAVQALYQLDMSGSLASPEGVVAEFLSHRVGPHADEALRDIDREWFCDVVAGVSRECADIDNMIAGALAEDWTIERLDSVLRAILRAATYELSWRADVPPRVVIDEYVALAHAFFEGKEPAMANGLLDYLARQLRPEDMAGPSRDGVGAGPGQSG
jgi:N utilization substance protein B